MKKQKFRHLRSGNNEILQPPKKIRCIGVRHHGDGLQPKYSSCNPSKVVNYLLADSAWFGHPLGDIFHPLSVRALVNIASAAAAAAAAAGVLATTVIDYKLEAAAAVLAEVESSNSGSSQLKQEQNQASLKSVYFHQLLDFLEVLCLNCDYHRW
ncbi:uncharacterized protein [Spinacia oleracea]|uniref:VAN3-binding protein-like auxin canalisation domain-containing protein n=1 Tax=Spinacia oleracea TaxID=3562 RepID=A0ABM3RM56_SPIOL|nr:uncharacterized protein LOC110780024 [Spinacia oleracea]XP_056690760.1 uncharacterized protein LOC110780024 [Spinacia oleracea]XP_056696692.1 uncharacterized protein LOC130470493 [Spinacia oleracea]XP_056696693.1 uncharacterized protein LOC130470493 [Spinacia oleracea]